VSDLVGILQEFYREKLAMLLSHESGARLVGQYDQNNAYQYIINRDAGVQITASDGEARRIGAGEVILVEDTSGKGHLSKAIDGKVRNCIFVTLE